VPRVRGAWAAGRSLLHEGVGLVRAGVIIRAVDAASVNCPFWAALGMQYDYGGNRWPAIAKNPCLRLDRAFGSQPIVQGVGNR
jgi:hypothetical protein